MFWGIGRRLARMSTTTFHYDPFGRLVEVADGTSTSRYVFDGQAFAAEYDPANTLVAAYVHSPTWPTSTFEMIRGGQRYFYLTDAQGSTTALTRISGTVLVPDHCPPGDAHQR